MASRGYNKVASHNAMDCGDVHDIPITVRVRDEMMAVELQPYRAYVGLSFRLVKQVCRLPRGSTTIFGPNMSEPMYIQLYVVKCDDNKSVAIRLRTSNPRYCISGLRSPTPTSLLSSSEQRPQEPGSLKNLPSKAR